MPDILHRVGIKDSSPSQVYDALTTVGGLARWWTRETDGASAVGDVLRFRFGDSGGFDMKVIDLAPDAKVVWEVVDGPADWIGTRISFELRQEGDFTLVRFKHLDWREPVEAMHHCSTKWATFLLSLKSVLETGKGNAYPNDIMIDNWR